MRRASMSPPTANGSAAKGAPGSLTVAGGGAEAALALDPALPAGAGAPAVLSLDGHGVVALGGELRPAAEILQLPYASRLYACTEEARVGLGKCAAAGRAAGPAVGAWSVPGWVVVLLEPGSAAGVPFPQGLLFRDPGPGEAKELPPRGVDPVKLFAGGRYVRAPATVAAPAEMLKAEPQAAAPAASPAQAPSPALASGEAPTEVAAPAAEMSPAPAGAEEADANGHAMVTAEPAEAAEPTNPKRPPSNWIDAVRNTAAVAPTPAPRRPAPAPQRPLGRSQSLPAQNSTAARAAAASARVAAAKGAALATKNAADGDAEGAPSTPKAGASTPKSGGSSESASKKTPKEGGKEKREPWVEKTVDVPSEKAGQLIGPGGETIQAIRAESGAKIFVVPAKGEAVVKGTAEAVAAAVEAITAKLAATPTPSGGRSERSGGTPRAQQSTATLDADGKVKRLLGPNGCIHKWMQSESGARIVYQDDSMIKITGTDAAVEDAKRLVTGLLDGSIEPPASVVGTSNGSLKPYAAAKEGASA